MAAGGERANGAVAVRRGGLGGDAGLDQSVEGVRMSKFLCVVISIFADDQLNAYAIEGPVACPIAQKHAEMANEGTTDGKHHYMAAVAPESMFETAEPK